MFYPVPSYNIAAILDTFVGENHPRFGKSVSQEVKDKISKSLTGRKLSEEAIEHHRKGGRHCFAMPNPVLHPLTHKPKGTALLCNA
jgi:hypothetical protein